MCARYDSRVVAATLYAGDRGDLVNPAYAASHSGRHRRAPSVRAACLLAFALFFILGAAAIGPSAARAATYNTWTKQTSGTTHDPLRRLLQRRQQRLDRGQRRPHPPHHERRHVLERSDLDHDPEPARRLLRQLAGRLGGRQPRHDRAHPERRHDLDGPDLGHHARPCTPSSSPTPNTRLGRGRRRHDPPHAERQRRRRLHLDRPDLGYQLDALRRALRDANSGWVVGNGGLIRHTANGSNAGGSTWAAQTSGTTQSPLRPVSSADASNGWVVGNGGIIRHTANGGTTWSGADLRRHGDALRCDLQRPHHRLGGRQRRHHQAHHQRRHGLGRADLGYHADPARHRPRRRQAHGPAAAAGSC